MGDLCNQNSSLPLVTPDVGVGGTIQYKTVQQLLQVIPSKKILMDVL